MYINICILILQNVIIIIFDFTEEGYKFNCITIYAFYYNT